MSLNLKNIVIDVNSTLGNKFFLTGVSPYYSYENGKKTEKIEGYKYTVAVVSMNLDKISVKISGDQKISLEDFDGKMPAVVFSGLKMRLWQNFQNRQIMTTVTADSINLVDE